MQYATEHHFSQISWPQTLSIQFRIHSPTGSHQIAQNKKKQNQLSASHIPHILAVKTHTVNKSLSELSQHYLFNSELKSAANNSNYSFLTKLTLDEKTETRQFLFPEPEMRKPEQLTCELLRIPNTTLKLKHHINVFPSTNNQDYKTLHFVSLISKTIAIISWQCTTVHTEEEYAKREVRYHDESDELVESNGKDMKFLSFSYSLEWNQTWMGGHLSDVPLHAVQWIHMLMSNAPSLLILLIVVCYQCSVNPDSSHNPSTTSEAVSDSTPQSNDHAMGYHP